MFNKTNKKVREYEDKIEKMYDYLEASIETYRSEIDFNMKLLEIDNENTKIRASKEIEKSQSVLWALEYLKRNYDKLFD